MFLQVLELELAKLPDEIHGAGALDLTCNCAMHLSGDSSHLTWKDTAGLGSELGKNLRIFKADLLKWEIKTLGLHRLVVLAEINPALDGLWFRHDKK